MKLLIRIFALLSLMMIFVFAARAQAPGLLKREIKYFNTIKLNPAAIGFSTINAGYERIYNENYSLSLILTYTDRNVGNEQYQGYSIMPELRYYLVEFPPQGLFLSGAIRYNNGKYSNEILNFGNDGTRRSIVSETIYNQIVPSVAIGYGLQIIPRLQAEIFAGPNYCINFKDGISDPPMFLLKEGLGLRTGINIGYRF